MSVAGQSSVSWWGGRMIFSKEHLEVLQYCMDLLSNKGETEKHNLLMDIYSGLEVEGWSVCIVGLMK